MVYAFYSHVWILINPSGNIRSTYLRVPFADDVDDEDWDQRKLRIVHEKNMRSKGKKKEEDRSRGHHEGQLIDN